MENALRGAQAAETAKDGGHELKINLAERQWLLFLGLRLVLLQGILLLSRMDKPIAERDHRIKFLARQRHFGIGTQLLLVVFKERVLPNLLLRLATTLLKLNDRRKILEVPARPDAQL